jgi:glycosyltransferase involved in cell wall biosynthesis
MMMRNLPATESGAAQPLREAAVPAAAAPRPDLQVLMLGPDLRVRGGVSAVEQSLIAHLPANVRVTHVATMVEGSKWRKAWTFAAAIVRTLHRLRGAPIDVVHIHFASNASSVRKIVLARLAMANGARVIMHAHGGGYQSYWAKLSTRSRALTLATLRRVDRLIVLGESWRAFFISIGLRPEQIVVLANPVVLPSAVPKRLPRSQVQLVYLGRISAEKGAFDLVEAVASLPRSCLARIKLVLAGEGELTRLRTLIEQRGIQHAAEVRDWLNPTERDRLLASSDVFVLPSYAEGLPMALLEAMAWGLPAICTPVGSIPKQVRDGIEGFLVQPGDVAGLARAIERIVGDDALRARMAIAARATVEPLSVDLFVEAVVALYRLLASDARVGTGSE